MSNTSATGGYLSPLPIPAVLEDDDLDDFFQEIFVGITGLPGEMFFPRWQPEPPNLPPVDANWASFGITLTKPDTFAAELPDSADGLSREIQQHEVIDILASFYGPNANRYAGLLRMGFQVAQNREVLTQNAMAFVSSGEPVSVPSLVKDKWKKRVDLPLRIRREVRRIYAVENLLSEQGDLSTEVIEVSINVNNP